MKYFYSLFLLISFSSCLMQGMEKDTLMSFDNTLIKWSGDLHFQEPEKNGWYIIDGKTQMDTTAVYNDMKSLLCIPNPESKQAHIYYSVNVEEIDGSSILLKGKYQFTDKEEHTLKILIRLINENGRIEMLPLLENKSGTEKGWNTFTVSGTIPPNTSGLFFSIISEENCSFRICDCRARIDGNPLGNLVNRKYKAKEDREFDNGSAIRLRPLSAQIIDNLEVLGKIWGFLKYYHPAVTRGDYNWDYELFRVLPAISQAKDRNRRNELICKWIDKLGPVTPGNYAENTDITPYSRLINLNWIENQQRLSKELSEKLIRIKNADRNSKLNYYLIPHLKFGFIYFEREAAYTNINWKDQGFRLLCLFRLWNSMEYCFPYLDLTDDPWDTLLKTYIPRFAEPGSKGDYELAILELAACLKDTHVSAGIPNPSYQTSTLHPKATYSVPVSLTFTDRCEIVVSSTSSQYLDRGDVITHIDGREVQDMLDSLSPFISASNPSATIYNALDYLIRTHNSSLQVNYIRNGKSHTVDIPTQEQSQSETPDKRPEKDYALTKKNIMYMNLSTLPPDSVSRMMQNNMEAKGLIIDLRNYPDLNSSWTLSSFLYPKEEIFAWFSQNEKSMPGYFKLLNKETIGKINPEYYKGKVAILVNENSMSRAEFCAMAFSKAPRNAVIGRTTAGADGTIGLFYLPRYIHFRYTALGIYYPDWKICQRKGVNIDIIVEPTVQDILEGKDVYIEKAIEYIEKL